MKGRASAAIAVFAGVITMISAGSARSAPVKAANSVSITLPGDLNFSFKKGAGSDKANTHCLTCHSSAYVSTQPPLDHDHWAAEVTKMRNAYHAEIPDKDAAEITDYLTQFYGKP